LCARVEKDAECFRTSLYEGGRNLARRGKKKTEKGTTA
jgi:hypothetical protein